MTKLIKRITVAAVVLFALIGAGGIVAFASGYITWGGTPAYEKTKANLDELESKRGEIITNLTEANEYISYQENIIRELEGSETALNGQIETLKGEITTLEGQVTTLENTVATHVAFEKLVKDELNKGIADVNNTNGAGPKYVKVTELVNTAAGHLGIDGRLESVSGAEKLDARLEQAEKDMKEIEGITDTLLDNYNAVELIDVPEMDDVPEEDKE